MLFRKSCSISELFLSVLCKSCCLGVFFFPFWSVFTSVHTWMCYQHNCERTQTLNVQLSSSLCSFDILISSPFLWFFFFKRISGNFISDQIPGFCVIQLYLSKFFSSFFGFTEVTQQIVHLFLRKFRSPWDLLYRSCPIISLIFLQKQRVGYISLWNNLHGVPSSEISNLLEQQRWG